MVAHDCDQRFIINTRNAELRKQLAERGVHIRYATVIGCVGVALVEWSRRIIGVVRIPDVNPQKGGSVRFFFQPAERPGCRFLSAPLHGTESAFTTFATVKARVVSIKPAFETWSKTICRIKNDGADKGPGAVTARTKQLWQIGREIG